ncbi:MAG TPA: sigma-70 family RNA polymerase sigma factor, partial [Solirubrobacteraceae bacterium]|nr:sigma-70 family RNA polymerase sigma factor [Solirubrobacteraceae bacterium]
MEGQLISGSRAPRRALALQLARLGDERLARLVATGDERAFAALYERYHQQLYRYCRSIVHSDADAQDALQSTLAGALVALQRGQRNAPLRPWLFRIAHNETVSLLRRRRPTAELTERDEVTADSTEQRAAARARLAQLVADLQALPERQRSALVMRELSGLSHEEIATALATTVGAAKQAIFEARQALVDFREGRAMGCEDVRHALSDGDRRVLRGRRMRAHLRDCDGCAAFAAAIRTRGSDLRILAPPLAPVAAAGVLAHLTQVGTVHGGGSLGTVASVGAGKTIGATLAAKALVGAAVLTAATVGVASVLPRIHHGAGGAGATPSLTSSGPGASARRTQPAGGAAGSAGARRGRAAAHKGSGARAASAGGVLGGAGSSLAPANAGLGHGHGARGAPAARGHAKPVRVKSRVRARERGSHRGGSSREHRSAGSG